MSESRVIKQIMPAVPGAHIALLMGRHLDKPLQFEPVIAWALVENGSYTGVEALIDGGEGSFGLCLVSHPDNFLAVVRSDEDLTEYRKAACDTIRFAEYKR